ncbi:hypothetical protein J6590_013510 [Homalodisca vitripennis]|nr:hypothetical protein J6590_013510 [Homalodisca vitripennis]
MKACSVSWCLQSSFSRVGHTLADVMLISVGHHRKLNGYNGIRADEWGGGPSRGPRGAAGVVTGR